MTTLHSYYNHLLSTLLERLVSPHIDEETWRERLAMHREVIEVKERIWLRDASEFVAQTEPYLEQIEMLLELTLPPLKHLMGYRGDQERSDYTRMTDYRGSLLDERERVTALLSSLGKAKRAASLSANDDIEIVQSAHP